MICPFCGDQLPRIHAGLHSSTRRGYQETLARHSRFHEDPESPYSLEDRGRWVLDPVRRVQVWQAA